MTITINVNGLTLCHKASEGVSTADLPDVCLTPPSDEPVPYDNVAYSADLVRGTMTVSADGGNMVAHRGSAFARSTGDEEGSSGGIASGVHTLEADWISFSFDVKVEGLNACRLTDEMLHNNGNTANSTGLLQRIIDAFVDSYWCGTDKAPAAGRGAEIPEDESQWDAWVAEENNKLPKPKNIIDRACMMHDLELERASYLNPSAKSFLAGSLRVAWAHAKLAFRLMVAAFSPGLTILNRLFALVAAPIFAALTVVTAARWLLTSLVKPIVELGAGRAGSASAIAGKAQAAPRTVAAGAAVSAIGIAASLDLDYTGAVSQAMLMATP